MSVLWVVEMWNEERRRWEPTVGVALTREECRHEMRMHWGYRYRVKWGYRYRVKKYVPEKSRPGVPQKGHYGCVKRDGK